MKTVQAGALKPGNRFHQKDDSDNLWEKTDDPSNLLIDIECICVEGPLKSDEPNYFYCLDEVELVED